jgi:hypothetical protein
VVLRVIAALIVIFVSIGSAYGNWVVSEGDIQYMYLQGGAGPELQVTLGYGEPSNTIGDEIWFNDSGIYDVSGDPDFQGFLVLATNGLSNTVYVTLSDKYGVTLSLRYPTTDAELSWLGHYPDLAPWDISGAWLAVDSIMPSAQGIGVGVHWEFTAVPEPMTAALLGLGCCTGSCLRRNRARGIFIGEIRVYSTF